MTIFIFLKGIAKRDFAIGFEGAASLATGATFSFGSSPFDHETIDFTLAYFKEF